MCIRDSPEDILSEIKNLVSDGVVEVMLLGQNVNSYGKTLKEPISFARLLQRVEQIDGLERIDVYKRQEDARRHQASWSFEAGAAYVGEYV